MKRTIGVLNILVLLSVLVFTVTGCTDDKRDYPEFPFQTDTEGYTHVEIARELSMMQPSMEAFEELWALNKWFQTECGHKGSAINMKALLSKYSDRCPIFCNELEQYLKKKYPDKTREELFYPFGSLNNDIWWINSYLYWDHDTKPRFAYFRNEDLPEEMGEEPKELHGFDSQGNPIIIERQEWLEGNVIMVKYPQVSIFAIYPLFEFKFKRSSSGDMPVSSGIY